MRAQLGAVFCFIISAHLPLLCYAKLSWRSIRWLELALIILALLISTFMAVTGTIAVFLS